MALVIRQEDFCPLHTSFSPINARGKVLREYANLMVGRTEHVFDNYSGVVLCCIQERLACALKR